jgi:hypothetical protein
VTFLTVRGAYSRFLGGVSLDESFRLEPSQLAGFNQAYRTIISESVVGSVSAPRFEIIGAALDLNFGTHTYVGLVGEQLNSDVNRTLGVYRSSTASVPNFPSSTPQTLGYEEHSAGLSINQLLSDIWALGASYRFIRSELDRDLPEVPVSVRGDARRFDRSDMHNASLYLLCNLPSGVFARAEANWYLQSNLMRNNAAVGSAINVELPGDQFWQINFWLGYRFRRNVGDISIGLLNATDTDYKLNPLNPYVELPRERALAARLRLRF